MTQQISFTIPGRVAGKGRPRAFVRGGKVGTYTPEKTRSAEAIVRSIAHETMRGVELLRGPVALEIKAFLLPPKSWSFKKRQAALYVTGKPDCDNAAKLVGDALNGIVYQDDSQIAVLHFERWYTLAGSERVEIIVRELMPSAQMRAAA